MERAALITGGSSGIGLAIARMLRDEGWALTLASRRRERVEAANEELDGDGVRAVALCPGFVDTPMAEWSGLKSEEMIRPEDCAEVVRMLLRLSPRARVPQVVIERAGSTNGDAPLSGV